MKRDFSLLFVRAKTKMQWPSQTEASCPSASRLLLSPPVTVSGGDMCTHIKSAPASLQSSFPVCPELPASFADLPFHYTLPHLFIFLNVFSCLCQLSSLLSVLPVLRFVLSLLSFVCTPPPPSCIPNFVPVCLSACYKSLFCAKCSAFSPD